MELVLQPPVVANMAHLLGNETPRQRKSGQPDRSETFVLQDDSDGRHRTDEVGFKQSEAARLPGLPRALDAMRIAHTVDFASALNLH